MKRDIFNHVDLTQIETLALDLEGTLISDATSRVPMTGLYEFLKFCNSKFGKIVIYTAVSERSFRKIARGLVSNGDAPDWFADLECVKWKPLEELKDLRKVNKNWKKVLIIDDMEGYILPEQKSNWIKAVPSFIHS